MGKELSAKVVLFFFSQKETDELRFISMFEIISILLFIHPMKFAKIEKSGGGSI